ncbi:MAG: hypothetical protein V3V08_24070 [Nannocystaceae bacterium]
MLRTALWIPLSAAPAEPSISWDAPASCPDARFVARRLAELLASRRRTMPDVQTRAVVRRTADGAWRLELELQTAGGTSHRSIEAASEIDVVGATLWWTRIS